jgi:hypothetical protein
MADEEEQQIGGAIPRAIATIMRPSFPGFRNIWRRFGGQKPPRHDPTKARVWFQPCFRVVGWDGNADLHTTEPCSPHHCSAPDGIGRHSEVRPDGFDWCGTHFSGLAEAKENQAFLLWYEDGIFEGEQTQPGKDVMAKGKLVLWPALYGAQEEPPLPRFNFFLHEHVDEMTPQEIRAYRATGEVPTRLRRRGRAKRR